MCVLCVTPATGGLWDRPAGKAVAIDQLAVAHVSGAKPSLDENRKVTVKLERPML